jgi:hypothetical protein
MHTFFWHFQLLGLGKSCLYFHYIYTATNPPLCSSWWGVAAMRLVPIQEAPGSNLDRKFTQYWDEMPRYEERKLNQFNNLIFLYLIKVFHEFSPITIVNPAANKFWSSINFFSVPERQKSLWILRWVLKHAPLHFLENFDCTSSSSSSSSSTPFGLRALGGLHRHRGSHYFLESLYTPGRWLA